MDFISSRILKFFLMVCLICLVSASEEAVFDGVVIADPGGPYYGVEGVEVLFDASSTVGDVAEFFWDFGDGFNASGARVSHVYSAAGFYLAKLSVSSVSGSVDEAYTGVYVRPQGLFFDVVVKPSKMVYDYGDVLSGVEVKVSYADGKPASGLRVYGNVVGRRNVSFFCKEVGSGFYYADFIYPFVRDVSGVDELVFVNVSVYAVDEVSGSAYSYTRTLSRVPEDVVALSVHPITGRFAASQIVDLYAVLRRLRDGRVVEGDKGGVVLYEQGSGRSYFFTPTSGGYVLNYRIPSDVYDGIDFLVYAWGELDGVVYNATSNMHFNVVRELNLLVVSPENGSYAGDVLVKVEVSYPDGSPLHEDALVSYVGGSRLVLQKKGDFYESISNISLSNRGGFFLWVSDSYGNGAGGVVKLSAVPPAAAVVPYIDPLVLASFSVFVFFSVLLFVLYLRSRRVGMVLERECEECRRRIVSLEAVRQNILNEFYTRKLSEQDARRRVVEVEGEIVFEKQRLKGLEDRLAAVKKRVF